MAYNLELADRLRNNIKTNKSIEEKKMMGGLCFMIDDKMCIGVVQDEIMLRINPDMVDDLITKQGCRRMDFTGRPMKGYIFVDDTAYNSDRELRTWLDYALSFNDLAKSSKKKK